MPPSSYMFLARQIQAYSGSLTDIWVGIADLAGESPESVHMGVMVDRVFQKMCAKGMDRNISLFLSAHSQTFASVLQDYASELTNNTVGLVLLGAFLKREHREKPVFPVPTLTVGGELDGVCRITRIMEEYYHRVYTAKNKTAATYSFPVAVVQGMTHLQFASGPPSDTIKKYDLKPEIDYGTAHSAVGRLVACFVRTRLNASDKNAAAIIKSTVFNASVFFRPLLEAYAQEGSYQFKLPCYDGAHDGLCQVGSAWTERAMAEMIGPEVVKVNDTDGFHPASQVFPRYYHPEIRSKCSKQDSSCVVKLTSVSDNIYYTDKSDSGLVPNAACEIRAKLKSRQSVLLAAGASNVNLNTSDNGSYCGKLNQLAYDWALNRTAEITRNRFGKFGVPIVMGEDAGSYDNGGLWIYLPMKYKQMTDSAGREVLQIRGVQLTTDVDYLIKIFAGMHYCKLLSPAKAMEWVYVDGLRAHLSLSGNRAELQSCGL